MKKWFIDKLWTWLGIKDMITSLNEWLSEVHERLVLAENTLLKKYLEVKRLESQMTEYVKIVKLQGESLVNLSNSLDNRRQEIDSLIERFQNLENEEVLRDLHLRIEKLEKK